MKNVLDYFKENNIFISFEYYGKQDLSCGWDIKAIIDNKELFSKFYELFPLTKIECIDDYFVFLLTKKFIDLEELIPDIATEENKKIVQQLVESAKNNCDIINNGDIIKYINKDYNRLFDDVLYTYDVPFITLNYITKFITGIKTEVIEFLITNHGNLIINNFDSFEKWFEKNPDSFEKLFPSKKYADYDVLHFDRVLDIWEYIYKKEKTNLKKHLNAIIPAINKDIEQMAENANEDTIINVDTTIREFNAFLIAISSPLANGFSKYLKKSKMLMAQYLEKHGHIYEYRIPVKEMADLWQKAESWEIRLISLTHSGDVNHDVVSRLSLLEHQSHPFLDLAKSNIPTNSYFTSSFQQNLGTEISMYSAFFQHIITDSDLIKDYVNLLSSATNYISEQMEDDELNDDVAFLFDNIVLLANNLKTSINTIRLLCYSSSMFLCSLTEKILRVFYKYLLKDIIYVPTKKATLGILINENNKELLSIFGNDHIKNLSYFLLSVQPDEIGHDLRNRLAHWSNINKDNMTLSQVAELLYLFTDVLNTIFIYFIKHNNNGDKNYDQL